MNVDKQELGEQRVKVIFVQLYWVSFSNKESEDIRCLSIWTQCLTLVQFFAKQQRGGI